MGKCERCGKETHFEDDWIILGEKAINPRSYLCQKCVDALGWNNMKSIVIKDIMGYDLVNESRVQSDGLIWVHPRRIKNRRPI